MLSQDLISVKLFDRIDSFVQTLSFFLKEVCKQFHAYFNLGEKKGEEPPCTWSNSMPGSPSEPTKEAQTKEPEGSIHRLLSAGSITEANVDRRRRREEEREGGGGQDERERRGEEGGGCRGEGRQGDGLGRPGQDARLQGGPLGVRHPPPHLRGRQPPAPDQVLAGILPACPLLGSGSSTLDQVWSNRRLLLVIHCITEYQFIRGIRAVCGIA